LEIEIAEVNLRYIAVVIGGLMLTLLVSCGGSSGQSFGGPAPVLAQSGFSNSTLYGTYGFSFAGALVTGGAISYVGDGIGTIQFDGNGNITGGTDTEYTSSGSCILAFSGNYTVSSTGALQATITSSTSSSGCSGFTENFGGEVDASGNTAVFAESDGSSTGGFFSGTAVKQQ
jgi:hypothetical protein